jgi:hypothetical protein
MANERYDSHFVFFLWLGVCRARETINAIVIYAMVTLEIKKKWQNSTTFSRSVGNGRIGRVEVS